MDERITVSVDDEHLGDLDEVADKLRAAGMTVEQVLGSVGIITGSASSDCLAALEQLPGVVSIEAERSFQIAPPDAEIQ